jgi:hypothetical protein
MMLRLKIVLLVLFSAVSADPSLKQIPPQVKDTRLPYSRLYTLIQYSAPIRLINSINTFQNTSTLDWNFMKEYSWLLIRYKKKRPVLTFLYMTSSPLLSHCPRF